MNAIISAVLDESKWFTFSMGLALLTVATFFWRRRSAGLPARLRTMAAMNLFVGVTIASMTFGHLLAVTTKLALGTLQGSALKFYAIGIVLAIPSSLVVAQTGRILRDDIPPGRRTIYLNAWLAVTLLALGLPNVPLAVPAALTIAYHAHTRRAVGWVIVTLFVAMSVGLFIGSLVFLASGQSFEQFRGMQ